MRALYCLATASPALPTARLPRAQLRRGALTIRATASGSDGVDPRFRKPSAELPGGVWWMSAPGPLGAGGRFARVAEHGEGFVILEGHRSDADMPEGQQPNGLQPMSRAAGAELVLGSMLGGSLAPVPYHGLASSDVIEVELLPMEEGDGGSAEEEDTIGAEACTGIVLHAALGGLGRGAPGLVPQAPKSPDDEAAGNRRRRSPRRTLPVRFTCNICHTRTTRVVNPYAWNHGTVFLECSGCHVKHKVKDNLNLFFEGQDSGPSADANADDETPPPASRAAPPSPPKPSGNPLLDPTNLSWALQRDADWRLPGSGNRDA
mmetsp:Transcript_34870/g.87848  ORF Transcript_34870/g.87848 Transcript_34870/m.87848 type:complete len:319 (+) Transcript_34870:258-1214(+)